MPRNRLRHPARLVLAAILVGVALRAALAAEPGAELEALRQEAVAAAQSVQTEERKLAEVARRLDLLHRELDGRQRGLDESRPEQAELLGIIERLSRNPPNGVALAGGSIRDRVRGQMLAEATVRNLRAQAQALGVEIERVDVLQREIGTREAEFRLAQEALAKKREPLTEIVARRQALGRKLMPDRADAEKRIARIGREAADFGQLIERAEAEAERRDKEQLARTAEAVAKAKTETTNPVAADAVRPRDLRAFDTERSMLTMPVIGKALPALVDGESPEERPRAAEIKGVPGGIVVAPFDGEIVYAGPSRGHGPSLILRHGGGYHSVLAGLGRLEIGIGQGVLAGEPVGMMPDAAGDAPGGKLYIELRRDGRPMDPRPWLPDGEQSAGRGERSGEQKVRE